MQRKKKGSRSLRENSDNDLKKTKTKKVYIKERVSGSKCQLQSGKYFVQRTDQAPFEQFEDILKESSKLRRAL